MTRALSMPRTDEPSVLELPSVIHKLGPRQASAMVNCLRSTTPPLPELPRVLVEEIEEVGASDVPAIVPGFAFFPDEGKAEA